MESITKLAAVSRRTVLSLMAAAAAAAVSPIAAAEQKGSRPGTRIVVDDNGSKVEVPEKIERVVVTNILPLASAVAVYLNDGSSASGWTRQAQNVRRFCFSGSGLIWVTQENQLGAWNASLPAPDGWTQDSQGTVPDFQVRDLASDGNGLLLLDSDGRLLRVYNNQVYETEGADVVNLYSSSASAVVERQDGSVQLWDLSLPTPGAVS